MKKKRNLLIGLALMVMTILISLGYVETGRILGIILVAAILIGVIINIDCP